MNSLNPSASKYEIPTFGLWYDFRNPQQWAKPLGSLYRESVDQVVWAESLGFGSAWLSEHHFAEDDYAASPLVVAAAIGARTQTMRIGTNIIVAGLHEPMRLAEDAAALSFLTDNRFELGLGLGYHEKEFAAFGRKVKQRPVSSKTPSPSSGTHGQVPAKRTRGNGFRSPPCLSRRYRKSRRDC
ncbi:LLM class flavin-dependent oxidoreductase [Rhodococcus sp. ACPA4]|uniref:LLM class flavin-dependent oxidoreductase n=1 Tax=Rhodococcus sp. ACPA4 TaxID=2028571 RepID=UPI00211C2133|nr:LLM class flavin-dependent oxidoreductase [Rhodococcus sp. ACPA4]